METSAELPETTEDEPEEGQKTMLGKFELYVDARAECRFRLKSGKGRVILASEGYVNRTDVENAVASDYRMTGEGVWRLGGESGC